MLMEDIYCTRNQEYSAYQWEDLEDQQEKNYTSLVLCGKMLTYFHWIIDWERGGGGGGLPSRGPLFKDGGSRDGHASMKSS